MIMGKLRACIAEIRKEHPHVDISITIPYYLPDDYFIISVFDGDTGLTMRRAVSMSDLDAYSGDEESFLSITGLLSMITAPCRKE